MNRNVLWPVLGLTAALAACGGHDEDTHEELSPAADACEHMIEGPAMAATAITDTAGDAPDVNEPHIRWEIALAADASDMYRGYIDLVVEESGMRFLFADQSIPMQVWDASGYLLTAHHTLTSISECTEVSLGKGYELDVGTYRVLLGPTSAQAVHLVVIPEGEHAE